MAAKRDYYEVLGVAKDATTDEIERAYRKLARQYHPDRNIGDPEAEVKFKEATEAHEILADDNKRERYDQYGFAGVEGPGGEGFAGAQGGFGDIMNDLLGAFMGGAGGRRQQRGGPARGNDLRMVLDITLLEAVRGVKKDVKVRRFESCNDCKGTGSKSNKRNSCQRCNGRGEFVQRQGFFEFRQTCPKCSGVGTTIADPCILCAGTGRTQAERTVTVTVPPGADTNLRLFVGGEGDAGEPGGGRGDLELVIRVAEHPLYSRDGVDLFLPDLPLTFSQAALGTTVDIPTLDGQHKLTIPAGTQSGTEFRIRGQGVPELKVNRQGGVVENTRRGDLRVTVHVETPTNLTKRHEELLREMADIEHKQVSPARKGFFEKLKTLFSADSDAPR